MKINYILSDTTKKATTTALSELVSRAENEPLENFIVIVPETKSIIIEREILELSKNGAFINVFVYSFVRLINRMGLISEEQVASKQTAIMLLRKVIYENLDSLVCYKKTAKMPGFADKIYETIAQFKSSNVTVLDLKKMLSTQNEALSQKLKDIVLLYEKYEEALGESLFDDCDKLALILQFAKSNPVIKNANVFVVGFDNITYEMQSVLKEIATNAKSVTFSAVYFTPQREDFYIQKNELYKKYAHIADELKLPYTPRFVKTYFSGDFYNIANYLFALKHKNFKSNGSVQVFEAKTVTDEIKYVANSLLKQVQNGKRFKDIGVLVSNLEDYQNEIEEVFETYKIPYFINKQHDISKHFYVRFLSDIFSCFSSNFSAEKVLEVLSNPLFDAKNYSAVFQFVTESGINYGGFLKENQSEFYQKIESYEKAKGDLTKFKDFAVKFKNIISNALTVNDFVGVTQFVNEFFDVQNKLSDCAAFERECLSEVDAQITEKVFDKIQKYVATFSNFLGNVKVSLDEFLQIFYSGLSTIKLNLLPVSLDCVVIQADTDGFFGIKDLFVMGAVEGKFPVKIQDSGIILDNELDEAKTLAGKPIEPTVKQINARENFRVYETFLEPKEKLFVTYSLKDISGLATKPARIVTRLVGLFGSEILTSSYECFEFQPKIEIEKQLATGISKFYDGIESQANLNQTYGRLGGELSSQLSNFLNSPAFLGLDFDVQGIDDLFFVNGKTSISQLEKYFACPYQFFATYGLRLKENKSARLSGIDVGIIIHRVAELFIKKSEGYESLSAAELQSKIVDILREAIAENNIVSERNEALLKLLQNESIRLCTYLLYERQNSSFKTMKNGTEFVFSGKNAVKIPLENGKVMLVEGKIDRIDEWGDYVRIIDYKTGDVSSDVSSIYFGKKIQLVSYLSAVTNLNGKKVAGLFYLPIHSDFAKSEKKPKNMYKFEGFLLSDIDVVKNMDNNLSFENPESNFVPLKIKTSAKHKNENLFEISGVSIKYLSEADFASVQKYIDKLSAKAIKEILEGNIEPSPYLNSQTEETPTMCSWCKFAGVCGLEKAKFCGGRNLSKSVSMSSFCETKGEEK